jgi:hypothetical protein
MDVAERPQKSNQSLTAVEKGQIGSASFVIRSVAQDLYHHIGAEYFRARGDNLCALINVLGVGVASFHASSGFDPNFHPNLGITRDYRRYKCYAPLPRKTLSGNTNNHGVSSLFLRLSGVKASRCGRFLKSTGRKHSI